MILFSNVKPGKAFTVSANLKINAEKLDKLIAEGVVNFFQSLLSAFKVREVYPIHISYRAQVVKKLFNEFIKFRESIMVAAKEFFYVAGICSRRNAQVYINRRIRRFLSTAVRRVRAALTFRDLTDKKGDADCIHALTNLQISAALRNETLEEFLSAGLSRHEQKNLS